MYCLKEVIGLCFVLLSKSFEIMTPEQIREEISLKTDLPDLIISIIRFTADNKLIMTFKKPRCRAIIENSKSTGLGFAMLDFF